MATKITQIIRVQRDKQRNTGRGSNSRETLGEGVTSGQREQQMQDEPRARFVLLLINGAPPQQRLKLLVLNPESASPNLGPYFPETEIFLTPDSGGCSLLLSAWYGP